MNFLKEIIGSLPVFVLVLFVIGLIVFMPFLIIWSINTLFTLGIPYAFKTWLAVSILVFVFGSSNSTSNEEKK
jgi:hypothetical protein